jgi:uncharacterized protein YuzE
MSNITIKHDDIAGAGYITVKPGAKVAKTVDFNGSAIIIDFDADGDIIGIEYFGATPTVGTYAD